MKKMLQGVLLALFMLALGSTSALAAPVPGAVFTTNNTCDGTNINIFAAKDEVHLDGGPTHSGSAGLADGTYYVQVTDPSGVVLGKSTSPVVVVSGGNITTCYQLSAIVMTASSGFTVAGYDTTSNSGGEYKVWISMDPTFVNSSTKTDNFKIDTNNGGGGPTPTPTPVPQAQLDVLKFYDANVNGVNDDNQLITGWKVFIQDGVNYIRFTPVSMILAPDTYTVTEADPLETNWMHTTTNPVVTTLNNGDHVTVEFGNVCTGAGGGHTLGFWSNKNGQSTMNDGGTLAPELAMLSGLNLRNANGSNFDPANYTQFRTWLLDGKATNMAYMLSVQLAAMELNVESGNVSGSAMIYAPGATSANALGFTTVNQLMAEANTELGLHGVTTSGSPYRAYQEALKNALDKGNNNVNFVQATPCPFSFAN